MTFKTRLLALALPIALCASPSPAGAWGNVGHAAIATIAEANLQPAVLAKIQSLLAQEGATHLSDVSSWADSQRVPGTPIHSTRIPVDGSEAPAHACPDTGLCADEAIAYYSPILASTQQSATARLEALKYIVHLVGDLHQPLHGSDPIGYNNIVMGLSVKTIHTIWDKDVVEDHSEDPAAIASELMSNGVTVTLGGTPRSWAIESSDMARDQIFDVLSPCYTTHSPICPVVETLPTTYPAQKYPLAAQRMKQAGYRLAALLNQLLA
ncbi:S1/P1 nuclease [Sphingomonas sp.]|uniref:S1/P1 nuclease n=1 Tax=Sphingomonas sp. TaxID=28214 RepID=UPI001EC519A8|nr:S1/P1 nuclease [Sphingomonas sp.]MBX3594804.1 S1/P1 nuclease [Sphingomonas sp.]